MDVPTIVATLDGASDKAKELQRANVQILQCKEKDGRIDLYDLMVQLGAQDIDGILLEGGGTLNEQALAQDIVQEVQVYIAPKIILDTPSRSMIRPRVIFLVFQRIIPSISTSRP